MNIIQALENFNRYIDQFVFFRMSKFAIGLYLIIITIATVLLIIGLVQKNYWNLLAVGQGFPELSRKKYKSKWQEIVAMMDSDKPNEWKASIIEASEMLDQILRTIGYQGGSLGERLKDMNLSQLSNIEEAREACKVRNQIVKDDNFAINKEDAKRVLEAFEKSLKYYEAID